jgi:hypothetical protein
MLLAIAIIELAYSLTCEVPNRRRNISMIIGILTQTS